MKKLLVLLIPLLAGCGVITEKVQMDDPSLRPMLEAAASFDREAYGFTPLPRDGDAWIEYRQRHTYDAMLHCGSKTSRTISFRKLGNKYKWIGEQEVFRGPNTYTSVDGTFRESICLTYQIEDVSGHPLNVLNVSYWGEDSRLAKHHNLTLEDVKPILREWKY